MSLALAVALKGIGYGLGAAVPLGPVNIEIIRRCLIVRPLAGASLGAGAVSADLVYLVLAFLGVGALLAARPALGIGLGLAGAAFLAYLGAMAILGGRDRAAIERKLAEAAERHANDAATTGKQAKRLRGHYAFGLAMTFLNPYTLAFWTSVSADIAAGAAQAGGGLGSHLASLAIGVAIGAGGWVLFLSSALAAGKRFAGARFLMTVSVLGGATLLAYAALRVASVAGELAA
jgi:threonine/homoserine/homoserine lactone efflux protein